MFNKLKYERLRGFRDLYPEDMEPKDRFFEQAKKVARSFGYAMIDYPSLESIELYLDKSGEELVGQTFSFNDKGGRNVTLLPEATPSVMRMLTSRKELSKPVRWFGIPKIWRYEEPQSGRVREHFQFNADLFGPNNPAADAEIIALASDILDSCGLRNRFHIRLNNRKLMDAILESIDVKDVPKAFSIIDRFHKIDIQEFRVSFLSVAGTEENVERVLELIKEKGEADAMLEKIELSFAGDDKIKEILGNLRQTTNLIRGYTGYAPYLDLSVVRGLSYYTGTVFEFSDAEGQFRSILGGGRYDNLSVNFSGTEIPAVGFGMGDVVVELMMKKYGKWETSGYTIKAYLVSTSQSGTEICMKVAKTLRERGIVAISDLSGRSIANQMKSASAAGAHLAFIAGDRENESQSVTVKDMESGSQTSVPLSSIDSYIITKIGEFRQRIST